MSSVTTIKTVAYKSGYSNSPVSQADYTPGSTVTMAAASPSFTLAAGAVSLVSATSGAAIRYTTDGSTPTATSGTVYTAPFTPASGATVNAIAYKTGLSNSALASATYSAGGPTIYLSTNPTRPAGPIRLTEAATGPDIVYQLRDAYGKPIPVSSGATIGIKIKLVGATVLAVNKSGAGQGCSVVDATKGIIKFSWSGAGITIPAAGNYNLQWSVDTLPYPVGDYLPVVIQGAL